MKRVVLLGFLLALFSLTSKASVLHTQIARVDASAAGEDVMVWAQEEGRVLWLDSRDEALREALKKAQHAQQTVALTYDQDGRISGAQLLAALPQEQKTSDVACDKIAEFVPSVLSSVEEAQSLFNSLDNNTKHNSQCYNRAYGWGYDMWRSRGVRSSKVFIFFTSKYIRQYKYKWWFHVAPFVMVATAEGAQEMVLDRKFSIGPKTMRAWTDYFMYNDAFCPIARRYSDYRQHQNEQYCFLMKASMYYRSPSDLELLETQGREELNWSEFELKQARKQAFNNWRSYYPGDWFSN